MNKSQSKIFATLSVLAMSHLVACDRDRPVTEVPAAQGEGLDVEPAAESTDAQPESETTVEAEPMVDSQDASVPGADALGEGGGDGVSAEPSELAADSAPTDAEATAVAEKRRAEPKTRRKSKRGPAKKKARKASKGEAKCGEGTCA